MDTVYLVDLVGPVGLLLLAAFTVAIGLWVVTELLVAAAATGLLVATEDQDSVYVVIFDDRVTVRDVFVLSDRGVAEQLRAHLNRFKFSGTDVPAGYTSVAHCRIDEIDFPGWPDHGEVMDG